MVPLLTEQSGPEAGDPYEILERQELPERGNRLDERAWDLDKSGSKGSPIYDAWVRYARLHPERVFGA